MGLRRFGHRIRCRRLAIHSATAATSKGTDDLEAHRISERVQNALQRYSLYRRMYEGSLHAQNMRTNL